MALWAAAGPASATAESSGMASRGSNRFIVRPDQRNAADLGAKAAKLKGRRSAVLRGGGAGPREIGRMHLRRGLVVEERQEGVAAALGHPGGLVQHGAGEH